MISVYSDEMIVIAPYVLFFEQHDQQASSSDSTSCTSDQPIKCITAPPLAPDSASTKEPILSFDDRWYPLFNGVVAVHQSPCPCTFRKFCQMYGEKVHAFGLNNNFWEDDAIGDTFLSILPCFHYCKTTQSIFDSQFGVPFIHNGKPKVTETWRRTKQQSG